MSVMQMESDYLSRDFHENRITAPKQKQYITPLKDVLELVVERLNTVGFCSIPIGNNPIMCQFSNPVCSFEFFTFSFLIV